MKRIEKDENRALMAVSGGKGHCDSASRSGCGASWRPLSPSGSHPATRAPPRTSLGAAVIGAQLTPADACHPTTNPLFATQEPEKQPLHRCIVKLVIGTLYCANHNYEFG